MYSYDAKLMQALSAEPQQMVLPAGDMRDLLSAQFSHCEQRILIIDGNVPDSKMLETHLDDAKYTYFESETDPRRALLTMKCEQPHVVLLDIGPDQANGGLQLLQQMRDHARLSLVPVIVLTSSTTAETKRQALESGAKAFLAKPIDPSELALCLQSVLGAKAHQDQLTVYSQRLERQILRRSVEVEESRREVLDCLAQAAEFRDDDTGAHITRVGLFVEIIASQLGFDSETCSMLGQAAQLHDMGKIGIPDSILLKPGPLTREEYEFMKSHCDIGRRILDPGSGDDEIRSPRQVSDCVRSPLLRVAAVIARTHHEKWDGSGYPRGLAGTDIPIEGRITAVADVFDALSTARPYKPAFPVEKCIAILEEGRGAHFDPQVLDAFLARQ